MTPTRPISSIKFSQRHRRDLGDIDGLAASIADLGLLQPIVIKPDDTGIAGERRFEACKRLGWTDMPVHVVNIDAIVHGELAENTYRKDFTPSEMVAIAATVEERERELAKARQTASLKRGDKKPVVENFHDGGKTRDKIATPLGVSGRTLEKAQAIVEAAKQDPDRFGHLVVEMDRPHGVNQAYYALRRARDQQRVLNLAPVAGKFRALVVDPPWAFGEDLTRCGAVKYATMEREEVLALPVASWAENNCHLYLWTTNVQVPLAVACMAAWGFQYKTMLTWAKPHYGLGKTFRGQTEHVLFGTRGTLATRCTDISTLFHAPKGAHSEKPKKFYEIVRAASYPPYGEAFQRTARPDFVNLFAEAPPPSVEAAQ